MNDYINKIKRVRNETGKGLEDVKYALDKCFGYEDLAIRYLYRLGCAVFHYRIDENGKRIHIECPDLIEAIKEAEERNVNKVGRGRNEI